MLMEKIFLPIYQFFSKRKGLLIIIFLTCFLIAAFFASKLNFEEDISKPIQNGQTDTKQNA